MSITINGSGTISGISAGGLPDGSVTTDDIVSLVASKLTGALPALDGSALTNLSASGVSSSSYATPYGYVVFDDGLIINWFYGYVGTSNFSVTWAQSYPTTFIGSWASMGNNTSTSNAYMDYIQTQNNSGATIGNAVGGYAQVISIGY